MEQISKNTVSAIGQLTPSEMVSFPTLQNGGFRILILGNSITRHGANADIGWFQDCGMAASQPSCDYVHLLIKYVQEANIEACFCIAHAGEWEQQYANGEKMLPAFERAREFGADIIIWRLLENCPCQGFDDTVYEQQCKLLLDFVNPKISDKIIMTTSFWKHPGDAVTRRVAADRGYPVVELGELGERDDMKALGLFSHEGVANHPGDKGMKAIAQAIWNVLESMLS